ncbi:toxin co-regulated pilus biosynthesis Q family protein [Trinickia diaoshuihuensis]|uniref:toxin co-regulated pilus biosynthesis Q family protein n=1 Tax=Trinickia diaoshuihuensis TaxID=2292265 RepID=UPI0013C3689E|nr:toxin co-regulated pilus biosynthesis Q family protein [Trinickia diaoshuihuensis]
MRKCKMDRVNRIAALTMLTGGIAWAAGAQAGFVNEAPAPSVPVAAAARSTVPAASAAVTAQPLAEPMSIPDTHKLAQVGFRPSGIDVPRGSGRDIALADMLPVVVPHTFTIDFGNVDRNQLASWSGGSPWDVVLADALAPVSNVGLTIDWDRRVVSLRRIASAVAQATQAVQPVAAAVAPPTDPTFALVGGQSLETQMQEWAKRAGWSLTWNTPDDWVVPHDYTYTGNFQDAVQQVFTQLADDGADVRADIWKGNSAVVVDKAGAHE